jgi:Do/DeqQ family serine protease
MKRLLFAKANNLVVIVLSIMLGATLATNWARPNNSYAVDPQTSAAEQKATLKQVEDGFTGIAEKVEPTVVTIEARATPKAEEDAPRAQRRPQNDDNNPFGDLPLPDFFRRFGSPSPDAAPARSGGSGIIVRADNKGVYVLTNNHVVRNRDKFSITLQDKSEHPATLVGQDVLTDLAVLKIEPSRTLPTRYVATLGDSSRVRVGQWAIAIGSPLSYDQTLTVGVISAKDRSLQGGSNGGSQYTDLIQTDAAINPGNSGGPLVNIDGEVVGINVAIASAGGAAGNIGIGFAIPINTAKMVVTQLIDNGKVTRGWLGITNAPANQELSPALREHYGVEGGALVEDVLPNSPAAKAGLQVEDVITKFGNEPINSFGDLQRMVVATKPNTRVTLTVVRDRKQITLPLTLETRPDEPSLVGGGAGRRDRNRPAPGQPDTAQNKVFGLTVQPPTDRSVQGVEVVAVAPASPAEDALIQAGDIIQRIGRTNITDLASFRKALEGTKAGDELVVRLRRQGNGGHSIVTLKTP